MRFEEISGSEFEYEKSENESKVEVLDVEDDVMNFNVEEILDCVAESPNIFL